MCVVLVSCSSWLLLITAPGNVCPTMNGFNRSHTISNIIETNDHSLCSINNLLIYFREIHAMTNSPGNKFRKIYCVGRYTYTCLLTQYYLPDVSNLPVANVQCCCECFPTLLISHLCTYYTFWKCLSESQYKSSRKAWITR